MTTSTTGRLRVDVDASRVHDWLSALDDQTVVPHQALGARAGSDGGLGSQRTVLAGHSQHVFAHSGLCDPLVRRSLVETAHQVAYEAGARALHAGELLAGRFLHRDVDLVVRLVPGTRLCFGLPDGGQVFGLVPGASAQETCCFLEHTFYHELSGEWASDRTLQAEHDRSSPEAVITWILSLVRNEGLANLFCLDELQSMDRPERWAYFTYADLLERQDAIAESFARLAQALDLVADSDVEDATAFVNGTLKHPDLPLLNLAGIHLARTVAGSHGQDALAELCHGEPEDLLRTWLGSGDPLLSALGAQTRARLRHWSEVRW